jgi:hypothetical protein
LCFIWTHILLPWVIALGGWGHFKWGFLAFFQYNDFYNEYYSFNSFHYTLYTFGGLRSSHPSQLVMVRSFARGWGGG